MQNREICEGSQKAKSFLFETAFRVDFKLSTFDLIPFNFYGKITIHNSRLFGWFPIKIKDKIGYIS